MSLFHRVAFRLVLAVLGLGLVMACRLSRHFREQVTRTLVVQVGSRDGVFHHYRFRPRALSSHLGRASAPDLSLTFDTARQGWLTLLHPHAIGKIIEALQARKATYTGNAVLVLWFYALTRFVLPIGRTRRDRVALPGSFIAPNPDSAVASRITREPAVQELDPDWKPAHIQRNKMALIKASRGEPFPLF